MINPVYIKTFMTLIETGHFTRTAERLHMTQPGVSQHVKKLEEHFQTSLVHRTGKSFTVTESGRKLIEYGKNLFNNYEAMKVHIADDDPFRGECRYSSPGSFGFHLFDVLLELNKKHRELRVSLSVAPTNSIPALLLSRQIDVGFMTKEPEDTKLESVKFSEEELLLIVPRKEKIKSFEDLRNIGFVSHPDGPFLAERLLSPNFPSEFTSVSEFKSRVFINQISRILDPVAAGLGFTVLPEGAFRNYRQAAQLSIVRLKSKVVDEIYKVQRKDEQLPNRYRTVENHLQQKASVKK